MKRLVMLSSLLVFCACGTAAKREAKMQDKIAAAWMGRPVEELKKESYLDTLKRQDADGKVSFTKEAQMNTRARCMALGGCYGMLVEAGCQHVFFTKDGRVTGYTSHGDCFTEMEWLLKKSSSHP